MKHAIGLALTLALGAAHAADVPNATATGIVQMSAGLNEMALACKHQSAKEIDAAKAKQKTAAMADLKISAADYDKLYTQAAADFQKQWASAPAERQKQSCEQMKNMPKSVH